MMSVLLSQRDAEVTRLMKSYNDNMSKVDAIALDAIGTALKKAITEYNEQVLKEVYSECMKDAQPMVAAITKYRYDAIYAKRRTYKGTFIGYERGERSRKIDLLDFCKYAGLPMSWQGDIEAMGRLLTMRNAIGIGKSQEHVKHIDASYYETEGAKASEIRKEEVPLSTTQLCKVMQKVIDKMIFVPSEKDPKKNTYRCIGRDVFYFDRLYSSKNPEDALKVKNPKGLRELMTIVLHRLVIGGVYDDDWNVVKVYKSEKKDAPKWEAKPEESKDEPKTEAKDAPTDAPKADTDETKAA